MRKITQDKKIIELLREYNNKFGSKPIKENKDIKVINLLREYNSKYELLNEAKSKLDILINKLGASEENAKILDTMFGGLSVWMANKLGDYFLKLYPDDYGTTKEVLRRLYLKASSYQQQFTSIKDYIVVGLNGNKSSLDNLNYKEIYDKSKEWHDSLNVGEGSINYVETHPIILDFRNDDGEGYYWVDLETYNSPEECERMGHCGRSSKGRLFSLRSDKKLGKFKLNRSHLTAAIGDDGILFQLKGPKNSKPKEEYHPYILPLFDMVDDNDEYFISGFGKEYASQQDFRLEDLPLETLKAIYSKRPDIFKGNRRLKEKMKELGIEIETEDLPTAFQIEIGSEILTYFIDGDQVAYDRTGYGSRRQIMLSEIVVVNDYEGMTSYIDIHHDYSPGTISNRQSELYRIENILNNYVYDGLKSQMKRMIIDDIVNVQRASEEDKIKYENKPLSELLIETEMGGSILYHLYDIQRELLAVEGLGLFKESLKNTLEKYTEDYYNGHIIFGKNDVTIIGDLAELVDVRDPEVLKAYDDVEDNYDEIYVDFVFERLVQEYIIPKPYWNKPDLNTIELDSDRFNEMLNESLNELEDRYNY